LARNLLAQYIADADSIRRQKDEFFEHRMLAQIAIAEGRGADAVMEVRRGDVDEDGPAQSCFICYYRDLAFAFDRAHETDSAIVYFERFVEAPSVHRLTADPITLNVVLRRLGELHEATGRRDRAIQYYARFVELWRRADPELQPQVAEIRRRIDRLAKAH
jgi:tetratricopeptide (TPR) repeat protein